MKCPKCGKENISDSVNCFFCNTPLKNTNTNNKSVTVKVSRLAITAIVLASCGLLLVLLSLLAPYQRTQNPIQSIQGALLFISLIIFIISIMLGFFSLIQIEISGGKKTGGNFSVGAIIASVLGCILPVCVLFLARTRSVAFTNVCGTNLSGIGKAMLMYANDYEDELPRAGGPGAVWTNRLPGTYTGGTNFSPIVAFGMNATGTGGGKATITSSFYLLVKYTEILPKSFICKNDKGVTEFKPPKNTDLVKLWDFGSEPWKYCSYAYHMPYSSYPLTISSEPGMAVAADRNPWIPCVGWKTKKFMEYNPDGDKSITKNGNSPCHQDEGQNVLFLDSHVDFECVSTCGVNEDNIYTSWNGTDVRRGKQPIFGSEPESRTDTLLVNDPPVENK